MKSITIHDIGSDLDKRISEKSKKYGLSRNRTVKRILQNTLLSNTKDSRREIFSDLFGKWTKAEKTEFEKNIKDLERVNESDWQE
jgi:hypothetical protein